MEKLEWTCAELPIDGQEVELVISGLQNPGEFYCYDYSSEGMVAHVFIMICNVISSALRCQSWIFSFIIWLTAVQTLGELSLTLTRHCETEVTPFNPAVGEPCCALFSGQS